MKKIKRILICAVLITVCFLLETTVFQKLAFASIIPNLLIIVTSSFCLLYTSDAADEL